MLRRSMERARSLRPVPRAQVCLVRHLRAIDGTGLPRQAHTGAYALLHTTTQTRCPPRFAAINSGTVETVAERPCFVVVSGPAASGKTTLARGLADVLGVPVL